MLNKRVIQVVAGVCMSGLSMGAFAWGMPKLPGVGGGSSSSGGTSPAQAVSLQNKIVEQYVVGEKSVLQAQSHYAMAYGDKSQADKLDAVIKTLECGATCSKKNLQTAVRVSSSANKFLTSEMAHKKHLTAVGRKEFVEGTGFYGVGILALTKVVPQLKTFMTSAQGAIKGAPFTQTLSVKHKLATGMFLAEKVPSYVGGLVKSGKEVISYARAGNIRLPENATSALGNL